jgi:hypothetical protein
MPKERWMSDTSSKCLLPAAKRISATKMNSTDGTLEEKGKSSLLKATMSSYQLRQYGLALERKITHNVRTT